MTVQVAKIFYNGRSQAVRLPKEFRFAGSEVYIRKVGDNLIMSPKRPTWNDFFAMPSAFGEDFLAERDNKVPQERDWH
jgi:antitoxin VapB